MSRIGIHNYEAFLLDYSEGNLDAADLALLKDFILAHPELDTDLEVFELPYITGEDHSFDFKNSLKKSEEEVPDEELLNYLEGNLSSEQLISFEDKLMQDKDLAKDLELYKKTLLKPERDPIFEFKSGLLKTDDDLVLNNSMIAYLENQLSGPEKVKFEKELNSDKALAKEFQALSKTLLVADLSVIYPDKEALKKENRVIALFSLRAAGSVAAAILLLFGFALVYNYYSSNVKIESGLAIKPNSTNTSSETRSFVTVPNKSNAPLKEIENNSAENKSSATAQSFSNEGSKKEQVQSHIKEDILPADIEKETPEIVKVSKEPGQETPVVSKEEKIETAFSSDKKSNGDSILNKQNYLLLAEDVTNEEDLLDEKDARQKGFWKRAVSLAKQANKLGVKSVDGQENSQNKYRLSFNSFSVEKK